MTRPIHTILYSAYFDRQYRSLTPALRASAKEREKLFRQDAFHPLLRTHKLKGELAGQWAFSITYDVRVMFRFLGEGEALFIAIGSHDAVY